MNTKKSTVLKLLGCVMLVLLAPDLQAQLLKKIQFTPLEGYTNGWAYGQPGQDGTNVWWNTSTYLGNGWTNADGSTFYDQIITNVTPDGKSGYVLLCQAEPVESQSDTMVFYMPFANQTSGKITVTWDWQFFCTNLIPADFDPTNNNYVTTNIHGSDPFTVGGTNFPGGYSLANNHTDMQLDFYDASLALLGPDPRSVGSFPAGTSPLCTQSRINLTCDCRPSPSGWGTDGATGPYTVDYKKIHMKCIADIDNDQFQTYAQRDGEQVWLTTMTATLYTSGWFTFRNNPSIGLSGIFIGNNDDTYPRSVAFSNIRVVGPNAVAVPTLSIAQSGRNLTVTFTGWLEAADNVEGPYTTVAVTPAPYTTPAIYTVPASGAKKFYRAAM